MNNTSLNFIASISSKFCSGVTILALVIVASRPTAASTNDLLQRLPARPSWQITFGGQDDYSRFYEALQISAGRAMSEVSFVGAFHAQVFVKRSDKQLHIRLGQLGLGQLTADRYEHQGKGLSLQFARILNVITQFVVSQLKKYPNIEIVKIECVDVRNAELNAMLQRFEFESRSKTLLNHTLGASGWSGFCLSYYFLTGEISHTSAIAFMSFMVQGLVLAARWDAGPNWILMSHVVRDKSGKPQLCVK